MLWQVAVAAMIGSLFYVRRVFRWLQDHLSLRRISRGDAQFPVLGDTSIEAIDTGARAVASELNSSVLPK